MQFDQIGSGVGAIREADADKFCLSEREQLFGPAIGRVGRRQEWASGGRCSVECLLTERMAGGTTTAAGGLVGGRSVGVAVALGEAERVVRRERGRVVGEYLK